MMCPMMRKECTFPDCVAVDKHRETRTNETCQGHVTYHNTEYLRCRHYPDKVFEKAS